MNVSHVMNRSTPVCSHRASLHAALSLMDRHGVNVLPVVDGVGRLAGLLSRPRATTSLGLRPSALVADVMETRVACCRPSDTLSDLEATMTCLRVDHVPVIDDDGRYRGVVSADSVSWMMPSPAAVASAA